MDGWVGGWVGRRVREWEGGKGYARLNDDGIKHDNLVRSFRD